MIQLLFFIAFALTAVGSALSLILQRNIIYISLSLIVVIASMAGLFLLLQANFLAVLQLVIYAGAIMVLFLFVIMMTDVRDEAAALQRQTRFVLMILFLIASAAIWSVVSTGMQ